MSGALERGEVDALDGGCRVSPVHRCKWRRGSRGRQYRSLKSGTTAGRRGRSDPLAHPEISSDSLYVIASTLKDPEAVPVPRNIAWPTILPSRQEAFSYEHKPGLLNLATLRQYTRPKPHNLGPRADTTTLAYPSDSTIVVVRAPRSASVGYRRNRPLPSTQRPSIPLQLAKLKHAINRS